MSKILIVGGAGYVGSAAAAWLLDRGHDIWILDDLSTGHAQLALGRRITHCRAGDRKVVPELLSQENFDCVMHFAAKSLVGESVEKPTVYYENNVAQTQALVEMMLNAGTKRLIFSSTCAIFGDPGKDTISEKTPKNPCNPYGTTKLEVEKMLDRFSRERGLQTVALRYFNAAGAEAKLRVGEWHNHETHLIPSVFAAALAGRPVSLFGDDYPTPDGTCVRDYIHVTDLARAHESAMNRLLRLEPETGIFEAFNIGSANGFSNREVIQACERVVGKPLKIEKKPRRPGDPPRLVANSTLAQKELSFSPQFGLDEIIASAWSWEKKRRAIRKPAVFLDRDGTLNEDPGYLREPGQLKILTDVEEGIARLKRAGFLVVVVSNQSGVARGLIQPEAIPLIHSKLDELLRDYPASIDHYELCFHHPDEDCDCRKPKPKLILDSARALDVDLSRSYMIGDRLSDLGAGRSAKCRAVVLVRTGDGAVSEGKLSEEDVDSGNRPDFIADSLLVAADWILSQETASS